MIVLALAVTQLVSAQPRSGVTVINQTQAEVRIYVDGREIGYVRPFDQYTFELSPGEHRIAASTRRGRYTWGPKSFFLGAGQFEQWTLTR